MVNWKFWSNENNNNNESSPLLNNNNQNEQPQQQQQQQQQQYQQQQQQQNGEGIVVESNNDDGNANYNIPLSVSSIGFLRNRQSSSGITKSSSSIPISQSMDSISNNNKIQGPLYEETPLTFSSFLNKLNKKNQSTQHINNNNENNENDRNDEDDYSIPSNSSLPSPQISSSNNNNDNNDSDSFNSNYNIDNNNNYNNDGNNNNGGESKKKIIKDKLKIVKKRIPYYIPILGWLPKYNREKAIGDITAGITTSIMLVPQSLAYALLVGLPPIYGLYTGLMPLLIYSITGTCAQISLGPEALVSLIVGTTLKEISDNADVPLTTEEMIASANILCFLVGIISLILGLLRFGFLSEVLSRPLIRGFINAVACTILIDQLDKLLGVSITSGESGWRKLPTIFKHWSEVNELSLIISVVSIVSLVVMGQIKKRCCPEKRTKLIHHIIFFIPSILVVVVVGISVSAGFKLKDKGIAVLGYYPSSFPVPTLPKLNRWEMVNQLLGPAFFVSIVGFVETISIAKNFATKHNYQVSTNRELVAIGASNIFGSIFLCFPIFASMSRSAVNDKAGAKTQLAGAVTFVVVLFTLLFLLPIFQYLPISIMSSIIFVAAMGLFEVHDIIFLWKLRAWIDLLLFSATFICTFIFSVEVGLVVSIGASILLVIRQSSAPHFTVLGKLPGEQSTKFKDIIIFPEAQQVDGVLVIRFEESLYFANIGQVKEILFRIETIGNALAHPSEMLSLPEGQRSQLLGIVFDMRNIPIIDASSTQILYEMVEQYKKRSIQVCFVKLRDSHKKNFIRAGFIDLIGTDSFFSSTNDAVNKIKSNSILLRSSSSNNTFTPNIPNNLKNSFSYSSYIYKSNDIDNNNNSKYNSNNNSGSNTPTLVSFNNNQNSPTNSIHNLLSISQYYNSILDHNDHNDNNSTNTTATTTTNDILVNAIVEDENNENNRNHHHGYNDIDNNYNI